MSKKRKMLDSKEVAVAKEHPEVIQEILEKFKELIANTYTTRAVKSYADAAVLGYLHSDEVNNNLSQFKYLIDGIHNIMQEQYRDKAEPIFLSWLSTAYDFLDNHDYILERDTLGEIKYAAEHGGEY